MMMKLGKSTISYDKAAHKVVMPGGRPQYGSHGGKNEVKN
jgi:hypothetical protein